MSKNPVMVLNDEYSAGQFVVSSSIKFRSVSPMMSIGWFINPKIHPLAFANPYGDHGIPLT
jgi:hypothetical protein